MEVSEQLHAPAVLPRGKRSRYLLDRGCAGPTAGLKAEAKRRIPALTGNLTPTVQSLA